MSTDIFTLRSQGKSLREISEIDGRCITTLRRRFAEAGRPPTLTEEERFWPKVIKTEACWLWTAALDSSGYGLFRRQGGGRFERAHRIAYEWGVGPIDDGLQIDHLCRIKNCVNPAHLEAVTARINTMRAPLSAATRNATKLTCAEGHILGGSNAYPGAGSGRTCRTCQMSRQSVRVPCPSCGKTLRTDSVGRHQRTACKAMVA